MPKTDLQESDYRNRVLVSLASSTCQVPVLLKSCWPIVWMIGAFSANNISARRGIGMTSALTYFPRFITSPDRTFVGVVLIVFMFAPRILACSASSGACGHPPLQPINASWCLGCKHYSLYLHKESVKLSSSSWKGRIHFEVEEFMRVGRVWRSITIV